MPSAGLVRYPVPAPCRRPSSRSREHGFASWPRLKAEAERPRAAADHAAQAGSGDGHAGQAGTGTGSGAAGSAAAPPPLLAAWRDLAAAQRALIDRQYADRPGLRPILDAVLAAAAPLGAATVEPRSTLISLISPGRTFASVKPTTRNRVDLGLRLPGVPPGGRLLAARDVGSGSTVRIALTGPDEVDEEVAGLLRRAYADSVAPAPPRRPARRPRAAVGAITVLVEGSGLPGRTFAPPGGEPHRNVHVSLCGRDPARVALAMPGRPMDAIEPVPGDAPSVRWEATVTVRRGGDGFDFTGPYVRGDHTDRNIGLAWGDVPGDGTLRLFRGAKLRLADVAPALIEDALRPGRRLLARVRLTGADGYPICARLRPPDIEWSVRAGPGA